MHNNIVPSGWRLRSLSDLASYINGYAFKPDDWKSRGLPIIRIAQITGSSKEWDFYDGVLADTYKVNTGDLIFSWSGTLSVVEWSGGPAWLNQHLFKVIPAAGVNSRFLYHVLRSSVEDMDKRAHGSTMKHIKRGELSEFFVRMPADTEEQCAIADILDTLDTQIQKTEAIIAKLQQVKQGLLYDLLTRGVDANGQLRPLREHAPELYKQSPSGWIPNEWEAGVLTDWLQCSPKNGYSPPESGEWTGTLMLGLGCLTKHGFIPSQLKNAPSGDPRIQKALLSDGDLLISRANTRETVGFVGRYRNIGLPCSYPDLMMRLTIVDSSNPEFMEYVLRSGGVRKQIQAAANGTSESMVKINANTVKGLKVALPRLDEQLQILDHLRSITGRIDCEVQSNIKLRKQKNGLMDDLLAGRVRVHHLKS